MTELPNLNDPAGAPSFQMVKVTNRNSFPIEDMHDGVPYLFKPNEPKNITPDVAQHIFAWPGEPEYTKLYMARRWGWNTPEHIKRGDDGRMKWEADVERVTLEPIMFDLVARDPDAPVLADPRSGEPEDELMTETDAPAVPMPMAPSLPREIVAGTRAGRGKRAPRKIEA